MSAVVSDVTLTPRLDNHGSHVKPLRLYNTLSRSVETFKSISPLKVGLYTCGPTVYHYAHIGNLRTYIFEDVLKRTLKAAGYIVTHVMNITDVGHLQSDADSGDDKMSIAAKRESKDPWVIARFYENAFLKDFDALNLQRPDTICRATEHIPEMIQAISTLEQKGFTYSVDNNVYYDISKFKTYADFGKLQLDSQNSARVDVDVRKRTQHDFVLWFSQSKFPNQIMKWESPWGVGFPGWHIECSVMAMKYLGNELDIHCGGIDHIPVHHTNEIAQAEAILGKRWTNYWLHGEFLKVDSAKMSKSAGDFLTLTKLIEQGFKPVHYRFFCLNSHYRNQLSFNFDNLELSRRDFEALKNRILDLQNDQTQDDKKNQEELIASYRSNFWKTLSEDLNTSGAMRVFRSIIKDSNLGKGAKLELLIEFDDVFGLDVKNFKQIELSDEQLNLLSQRTDAKSKKNYPLADQIRTKLEQLGILLKDEAGGITSYYETRRPIVQTEAKGKDAVSVEEVKVAKEQIKISSQDDKAPKLYIPSASTKPLQKGDPINIKKDEPDPDDTRKSVTVFFV